MNLLQKQKQSSGPSTPIKLKDKIRKINQLLSIGNAKVIYSSLNPVSVWSRESCMSPTMCFELVCHLVDFALQSGMSGKFIHHADCGLLLLHFMDLSPHFALLFSIFLDQFRQLEWEKNKKNNVSRKRNCGNLSQNKHMIKANEYVLRK